ncbi:hypothetical protein [Streptomyces sp. NPDC093589]|uniref:hypothetical protein n=1 Tax=Streptomyces sp. NPDC093589 TaxID=3366043 RepID=UPI0038090F18
METAHEEIRRLEYERREHSETFRNTSEADTVTRVHLQEEMDRRTARIRELQEQRPLGFLARWGLRAAAAGAAWCAFQVGPWWSRALLGALGLALAFLSLG